jgi:hypothetical protein
MLTRHSINRAEKAGGFRAESLGILPHIISEDGAVILEQPLPQSLVMKGLRFFALAGDMPVIIRQSACLQCCIDISRRCEYKYVVC